MSSSAEVDNTPVTNQEGITSTTVNPQRRVRFPSDESRLRIVSIAPEPLANQPLLSLGVIIQRYRAACQRTQIRPLNTLLDQLNTMDDDRRSFDDRLPSLKITNEKLDLKQIEAIEEILSRCRFHLIDLDSSIYDDTTLIQLFDIIEYYESCTHLNLSNHRLMGAPAYQALARYLRRTHVLERLDMNSVRFDEANMFGFGRALRLGSTLYELHVESCQLNGKILQKFIQNLRACATLRELYLCDNRLQVQDSLLINDLIRSCGQFLHLLDLRSNMLQDNGISHIASQLSQYDEHHAHQNAISKFSFQANQLTQQGVAFLAKCLLHNRTIHSLNLSQNHLTNEGLFLLRDALLTNRTINELILRNCRLTDQAAIALAEYIAESSTIQYVDLRENNIQASGICGIAIAIKNNRSLLRIDFDPIVPGVHNSHSVSSSSIDRTSSNNSLLSLNGLRRVTAGLGSFASSASFNLQSSNNTPELIEQKTKWMNDIAATCQRNAIFYEENLLKEPQQVIDSQEKSASSEIAITNGVDHHPSNVIIPCDNINDTSRIENDESRNDATVPSDSDDYSVPSNGDNGGDVLHVLEDILKRVEAENNGNAQDGQIISSNNSEGLPSRDSLLPNESIKIIDDTPITNDVEVELVENNINKQLVNGDTPGELQADPNAIEVSIPDSSCFSLVDNSDDNCHNNDDDEHGNRTKIQHSDSLHLLRKKVQHDADDTSDDESTMSTFLDESQ